LSSGPEVRLDEIDLAVMFGESQHRDMVPFGERCHRLTEGLCHALDQSWRSNRLVAVLAEEGNYLNADLQGWDIRVQVDAVEALQVQHDVPLQNLIDGRHG